MLGEGFSPRSVLSWIALAAMAVWSVAIVATALRVHQVRGELGRIASDVAHHNAGHHRLADAGSSRYLDLKLRADLGRFVRRASVRVIRRGTVDLVEVRLEAVVGFALGGHPTIAITVVGSAPVEGDRRLP